MGVLKTQYSITPALQYSNLLFPPHEFVPPPC